MVIIICNVNKRTMVLEAHWDRTKLVHAFLEVLFILMKCEIIDTMTL